MNHIPQQQHVNRMAKRLSKELGVTLTEAQKLIAKSFGFDNYRQLCDNCPTEARAITRVLRECFHYVVDYDDTYSTYFEIETSREEATVSDVIADILNVTKSFEGGIFSEGFCRNAEPSLFAESLAILFPGEVNTTTTDLDPTKLDPSDASDKQLLDEIQELRKIILTVFEQHKLSRLTIIPTNHDNGPNGTDSWYMQVPSGEKWFEWTKEEA